VLANAFHADLKRIQNAANLQWPASHPAHAEQRALFRLRASPRATSARTAAAPVVVPLAAPAAVPAEDPAKALGEWPDGAAVIPAGSPPSPWPSPSYLFNGVRPSPGAETQETATALKSFGSLETAEVAAAEDGRTPLTTCSPPGEETAFDEPRRAPARI
jgi:hypothetical protein